MHQFKIKVKSLLTNIGPRTEKGFKLKDFKKNIFLNDVKLTSFGNKNPTKIFLVINRSPGSGFFSNYIYILNHLYICEKFNLIPIIDMKNFKTIYNDKSKLKNINAWNYYFKIINNYKLSEVYKSKNVIFSGAIESHENFFNFEKIIFNKRLKKRFIAINKKYFSPTKKILDDANKFSKQLIGKKVLGLHLRGTTYKTAPKHPFPLPVKVAIKNVSKIIKKYKYDKIFLITEEKKYLETFKNYFGKKLIYFNSYRSFNNDAFEIYPRKLHRYKLGKEILIETIILSKCNGIIFNTTNVSSAGIFFSRGVRNIHKIFLGYNSANIIIASFLWYLKSILPSNFLGFKVKLKTIKLVL